MYSELTSQVTVEPLVKQDPIAFFRSALEDGRDWPDALLESMAIWSVPSEILDGRVINYVIGGEAFDWLVLAERLCGTVQDFIPQRERDALLFDGRLPDRFDSTLFKDLIEVDKYRGYLNYFYGIVVEEALQHAVEREVNKRHLGNGNQYQDDFSSEAFSKIYHESKEVLFSEFSLQAGVLEPDSISFDQLKEFTYWLFKYRMKTADKAKIASDTKKGLEQLKLMSKRYWPVIGPY